MKQLLLIINLTALILLTPPASAQNGGQLAKPLMGFVTATGKDGFTVKGDKGGVEVMVSADTSYTTGKGDQHTEMRPQLQDHVLVYGATLENGEVAASNVVVHRQAATDVKDGGNHAGHGGVMDHMNGEHAAK